MSLNQLSVFLENRTGELAEISSVLAENNIDLRALHITETADYGVLRVIASDWKKAESILGECGIVARVTPVISVAVPDVPGGLSHLLNVLAQEKVNISYMYSVFGKNPGVANMIFKTSNVAEVEKILKDKGFSIDSLT